MENEQMNEAGQVKQSRDLLSLIETGVYWAFAVGFVGFCALIVGAIVVSAPPVGLAFVVIAAGFFGLRYRRNKQGKGVRFVAEPLV